MRGWIRQFAAVVRKDLTVEFRTRERLVAMAAFSVLVGVLFNFAIDPTLVRMADIGAGMIWLTLVFAGVMGVGRTFQIEAEDGAFQGVLLTPVPRDALFLAKVTANVVVVGIVLLVTVAVFGVFFHLDYGHHPLALLLVLSLGLVGFVALATLFAAVSTATSLGETLLPILLFPLLVPMVVFGVSATQRLLVGRPLTEVEGNIRLLAAFAVLALAVGALLFRFVVED